MSLLIDVYAEESYVLRMKERDYLIEIQFQNHFTWCLMKQDLRQVFLHAIFINLALQEKSFSSFFIDVIIRRNKKSQALNRLRISSNRASQYTFDHF